MGNAHVQAPPTDAQAVGLEISRMVAGLLSWLGATYIIQHVVRSSKRRQSPFHRLILGMSLMDWVFASVSAFSSTIAPKEMDWLLHFATGTWGTCEAFGFLGAGASLASIGYNGSLTVHYLLSIRYGWTDRALSKLQWWLHGIPLLYGWTVAVVALPLNYFNPVATGCSLAAYPFACKARGNCDRGEHAFLYRIGLVFGYLWVIFVFSVVAMYLMYAAIVKIDNQQQARSISSGGSLQFSQPTSTMAAAPATSAEVTSIETTRALEQTKKVSLRFRSGESNNAHESAPPTSQRRTTRTLHRLRKEFAVQAFLYCAAFFFTWVFASAAVIMVQWTDKPIYMPVVFLSSILESLQGFWNSFIYIRPRLIRWWYHRREQNKQPQEQQQQQPQLEQQREVLEEEEQPEHQQETPGHAITSALRTTRGVNTD